MIVIFSLIALTIAFLFYRKTLPDISTGRRLLLGGLRASVIFAVLLLLFNPILFIRQNFTEKPVLLLLSDKSNSMGQIYAGKSKSEHLSDFEREMRELAQKSNYTLQYVELFKDNPKQSILLDELAPLLYTGKDIQAIAIASDGWFQDEPALFRQLVSTPIFTYNPQVKEETTEIIINSVAYNKNARKNEIQPIRVNFTVSNYEGNIEVTLKEKQRVLQKKTISIDTNSSVQQVNLDTRFTTTGLKVLEIDLSTTQTSSLLTPHSTNAHAAIQVLDTKAKILILTDSFVWDIRTFNRYLNFGDRFDTDLVYIQNGQFKQKGQVIDVKWQDYAGFIVLQTSTSRLPQNATDTIKNKILNGSGLIYIGNINPAFEEVLPSRVSNIRILSEGQTALRPEALSYQIFREIEPLWSKFPPVQYHYFTAKEQSVILAETTDQNSIPVIFLGHYGTGNVLHFAFAGLWRWQLTSDNAVFDKFINGLGQWIFSSNTDNFYAYTDKNIYYQGERITVKLTAFDERLNPLNNLNARIDLRQQTSDLREQTSEARPQAADSKSQIANPRTPNTEHQTPFSPFSDFLVKADDLFLINLPELPAGTYNYTIFDDINKKEAQGSFEVLEQDIQTLSKGFNHKLLIDLSLSSGGQNLTAEDLKSTEYTSLLEKADTIKKHRYIEIPLHKNSLFIVVSLLAFCVELYLRKKWGLF